MCFKVENGNAIPVAGNDNENVSIEIDNEFSAPSDTAMCFSNRCFFSRKGRGVFWFAFSGQLALIIHFSARA